ncbi:MAG TPA: TraR/DksA family transcriptional regulator, partial [Burkholderiales bacterium]
LRQRRKALFDEVREKIKAVRDPTGSDQADELIEAGDAAMADLLSHTNLAESQRDWNELQAIEAALARIADGSYGICVQCGNEIEPARLKVQPTAIRCMRCQEAHERTYAGAPTPTL